MAMSKAELTELHAIRTELAEVRAELSGVKIIVPVMAATNGLLIIIGLSLVGTLIFQLIRIA